MHRNVHILITADGEHGGGFVAECPQLGAVTQGDTLDETLANAREVVALALEDTDPAEYGLVANPTLLVTLEMGPISHAG